MRKEATIGNRALAGAAAGGGANLVQSSLRAGAPSQTFRSFVGRCLCLGERGYDVVSWKWSGRSCDNGQITERLGIREIAEMRFFKVLISSPNRPRKS